jgi:hypothetical protein
MTQKEIKALASEIIGDGQTPNKFFVTTGPWVTVVDEFGNQESQLLDGFTEEDSFTKVFDTYEEAEEYYNEVDIDIWYNGIGSVMIEDRKTGTIKEMSLQKIVTTSYSLIEHDDSKQFGYKK